MVVLIVVVSIVLVGVAMNATVEAFKGMWKNHETITGRIMPMSTAIAAIIIMVLVYNREIEIIWPVQILVSFIIIVTVTAERIAAVGRCDKTCGSVDISIIINAIVMIFALLIAAMQNFPK